MEAKVLRHPQERAVEAADRISRLQYALDLLGHDSPEAEFLKVSVQEESCVRPVGELDSHLQHRTCDRMRVLRGRVLLRPISTEAIVFFYLGQFYLGQVRLRPGQKLGGQVLLGPGAI